MQYPGAKEVRKRGLRCSYCRQAERRQVGAFQPDNRCKGIDCTQPKRCHKRQALRALLAGGVTLPFSIQAGSIPSSSSELAGAIRVQIEQFIEESDLLILVVDARAGLMPEDQEIADILRRAGKPVLVVSNKCDAPRHEYRGAEFYSLGFPEVLPVSAAHGIGVGDLLDRIIRAKQETMAKAAKAGPETGEAVESKQDEAIRVAIVGKPNVGKSSLVNRLLGQPRMIVSSMPGTTVDAVDITFTYEDTEFVIVDTAGMRRPARIGERLESLAVGKALRAVKRCDIAILVLDGPNSLQPRTGE